jgi:hypothetical protein
MRIDMRVDRATPPRATTRATMHAVSVSRQPARLWHWYTGHVWFHGAYDRATLALTGVVPSLPPLPARAPHDPSAPLIISWHLRTGDAPS